MDKIEGRPITPEEAESFYVIPKGVYNVLNIFLQKKVPYECVRIHKADLVKAICEAEKCADYLVEERKWIKCVLQKYREAEWNVSVVLNAEGFESVYEFRHKRDGPVLIPIKK